MNYRDPTGLCTDDEATKITYTRNDEGEWTKTRTCPGGGNGRLAPMDIVGLGTNFNPLGAIAQAFGRATLQGYAAAWTGAAPPVGGGTGYLLGMAAQAAGVPGPVGSAALGFSASARALSSWHRATFATEAESAAYHYGRHVLRPGLTHTFPQYTRDALTTFEQFGGLAKPVTLRDGSPGLLFRNPGNPGGYFTPDGRIVTFWYR